MTALGDALVRRHAAETAQRVAEVRLEVERVVLNSGLPASGNVNRVVASLAPSLLALSGRSLIDQVSYAANYAAAEDGLPPQTSYNLRPSADTEDSVAGLAIVMRSVIKKQKQRNARAAARILASVTGGQASRAVMHDAREWAQRYLATDPGVRAYRRVPDEDPCYFCAMLASRGFVYRTKRSAGDVRVVQGWHPACACTTQPVFVGTQEPRLDVVTIEAQRVYGDSTGGHNGKNKARAFRRAWENRRQK